MGHIAFRRSVVPGRLELPTSTLSVWRSNQLSYRTLSMADGRPEKRRAPHRSSHVISKRQRRNSTETGSMPPNKGFRSLHIVLIKPASLKAPALMCVSYIIQQQRERRLQKGGVPAAPSGTATLLRLSPNHQFRPRPILAVTDFRRPRLSWLDGRCVQGPGTYSPRHG